MRIFITISSKQTHSLWFDANANMLFYNLLMGFLFCRKIFGVPDALAFRNCAVWPIVVRFPSINNTESILRQFASIHRYSLEFPFLHKFCEKNSQNPERKFTTTTTIQKSINQNQIILLLFKNGWFWIYIVVMSFSFTLFCRHTLLRNCVYIEFIRSQGRIEFAHIRTHRESLCGARLPAGTSAVSVREFECANHGMENSSKLVYIYAGTIFSGEIKSENGISIIVNNKMGSKTSHFNHCCHAISSGWRATCVRVCVCVA